jgi:hypothetical protein
VELHIVVSSGDIGALVLSSVGILLVISTVEIGALPFLGLNWSIFVEN